MEKRIYRSRKDKVIGGVIAGAVEYFGWNIDPNLVRILYVILSLVYGTGILAYIIAWIIIPKEPFA
jgi:phage shock protein C